MIAQGANNWNNALVAACRGGDFQIIEFIIACGANDWNRAFSMACERNHILVAKYMIECGANRMDMFTKDNLDNKDREMLLEYMELMKLTKQIKK